MRAQENSEAKVYDSTFCTQEQTANFSTQSFVSVTVLAAFMTKRKKGTRSWLPVQVQMAVMQTEAGRGKFTQVLFNLSEVS